MAGKTSSIYTWMRLYGELMSNFKEVLTTRSLLSCWLFFNVVVVCSYISTIKI